MVDKNLRDKFVYQCANNFFGDPEVNKNHTFKLFTFTKAKKVIGEGSLVNAKTCIINLCPKNGKIC